MVGKASIALALALLGMSCGDEQDAAEGGESVARTPAAGRGGDGDDQATGGREPQSGNGGGGSSAARGGSGGGGASAAGSGGGGAGQAGNSGAGAGGRGHDCPAAKHEALSVWCAKPDSRCDLTLEHRRERYCARPSCGTSSCAVFEGKSSCGGRAIGTILGGDVYSEFAYYDTNGNVIGVAVQRPNVPLPCNVSDVYGQACQYMPGMIVDCSAFVDAGQ